MGEIYQKIVDCQQQSKHFFASNRHANIESIRAWHGNNFENNSCNLRVAC